MPDFIPILHQPLTLLVCYKKKVTGLHFQTQGIYSPTEYRLQFEGGKNTLFEVFVAQTHFFPSYWVFLKILLLKCSHCKRLFLSGLMPNTEVPYYYSDLAHSWGKKQLILSHRHSRHFAHSHPCITSAEKLAFHAQVGGIK